MAQYFVWGADLIGISTQRFRTATLSVVSQSGVDNPSGNALQIVSPNGRYQLSVNAWDGFTGVNPLEVRARLRHATQVENGLGLWLAGSGAATTEGGAYVNPRFITGTYRNRLLQYVSGTPSSRYENSMSGAFDCRSWFYFHSEYEGFGVGGDLLITDMYDGSESVSGSTLRHSSYTSGWFGLGSASPATYFCDWISVGTDGDPAPTGPVSASRRRSPLLLTPW